MRSAITERPMRMPSGTPTTTAMALPSRKALAVIHSALAKLGVGTISMMRATMADSGGMMKLAPVWPTISHSVAQMISEQNSGVGPLTPKDRKSVGVGKGGAVRVDQGCRGNIKQKNDKINNK